MKRLLLGIVLGVLGVRIFDAITEHKPVIRPPPLEFSEESTDGKAWSSPTVRKLPMRIRVDAIEPRSMTLISERKDGLRIRSVVSDRTEIRNGFASATFAEIKVGDMVNGSRVKRAEDEYEVISITKFEPSREALDKQAVAAQPVSSTQAPEESTEPNNPGR